MTLVDIARLFLHVREAGPNKGLRVNAIQTWSGGQLGDSWCAEMAWMWLDLYFKGHAPMDRFQSVEEFHQLAITKGWIVETPQIDDLVISIDSAGLGHHIALVTETTPLTAIAGNTSPLGNSASGDGCYEHAIRPDNKVYVRIPGVA